MRAGNRIFEFAILVNRRIFALSLQRTIDDFRHNFKKRTRRPDKGDESSGIHSGKIMPPVVNISPVSVLVKRKKS